MNKNIFLVACLLAVFLLPLQGAYAGMDDELKPLLIDVVGWQARDAEGMSMDMGGMKMINATRSYKHDAKELDAVIMVGANAMTHQGELQEMSTETSDGIVKVAKIDGFMVQSVFDKKAKSGSVIIFLGQSRMSGAVFTMTYKGISMDDAMDIAGKFNWQKMKKVTAGLL